MEYELKIANGLLVDGSGAPARRGEVGIRGGRIVALGEAKGDARTLLDATDCVVAPGFVDIHTHYDAQILWDRMLSISPWHGVTTVVMGNCGFGIAPTRPEHRELVCRTLEKVEGMSFEALEAGLGRDWPFESFPQYLDAIERAGVAINVGALVGHTPVRLYVMGEEASEREATAAEVAAMRALVREAIDAGAVGFATSKAVTHVGQGGRPVPSRAATLEEIQTLAGALREAGRGLVQATFGPGLFVDELAQLARTTGRPVSWTALLSGMLGPGAHRPVLQRTAELAREGLSVVPQVACRPLNFEFQLEEPFLFESMGCFKPVSAADHAGRLRIYADPRFREAFKAASDPARARGVAGWWQRTVIAEVPQEPVLAERSLETVARERGVHPLDLALDLGIASDLRARFRVSVLNFDEAEVAELLRDPHTILGLSDAGAHASQLCDACFSTHLLGHWVRELGVLRLEEAVRMLTSEPARVFGLGDRGRLAVGAPADVVVFDPDTVAPTPLSRVRDLPAGADRLVAQARGIEAVVVNGRLLRRDGKDVLDPTGPLPGRVLRGGVART